MTNLLAAVIVTIGTNWTPIGTFTPTGQSWNAQTVERGNIVTNTTAILEWKGGRKEMLLESQAGPEIGERKIPANGSLTNSMILTPGQIMTNYLFDGIIHRGL
jgi:hypothetical protein